MKLENMKFQKDPVILALLISKMIAQSVNPFVVTMIFPLVSKQLIAASVMLDTGLGFCASWLGNRYLSFFAKKKIFLSLTLVGILGLSFAIWYSQFSIDVYFLLGIFTNFLTLGLLRSVVTYIENCRYESRIERTGFSAMQIQYTSIGTIIGASIAFGLTIVFGEIPLIITMSITFIATLVRILAETYVFYIFKNEGYVID